MASITQRFIFALEGNTAPRLYSIVDRALSQPWQPHIVQAHVGWQAALQEVRRLNTQEDFPRPS